MGKKVRNKINHLIRAHRVTKWAGREGIKKGNHFGHIDMGRNGRDTEKKSLRVHLIEARGC